MVRKRDPTGMVTHFPAPLTAISMHPRAGSMLVGGTPTNRGPLLASGGQSMGKGIHKKGIMQN